MHFKRWIFAFLLSISCFANETPFLGTSIPKSGTHLLMKLLNFLTECKPTGSWNGSLTKTQMEELLLNLNSKKLYSFSHANEPYYLDFAQSQPEYIKLIQIRDLRDTLISAVFHFDSELEKLGIKSFEDRLTFILTSDTVCTLWVKNNANTIMKWISLPNAFVIRFEDLVGEKGQGSEEKQRETIQFISSLLNIRLTQDRLDWIVDHLFGGDPRERVSWTFRRGQIGDWKKYFQPHHRVLFNQLWGAYQQALGYPLCEIEEGT